jgi:nucleotide-binding universal stress UspA family protein
MGTHGRTGLGRLLLGSVAEKVLRNAHCPVLTVRPSSPEAPGKIETILFPTDFSECSQNALQLAFELTRKCQARLLVLHVATPPLFVTYGEFEKVLEKSAGYRHELEEQLRQCQAPDCNREFRLAEGDPAIEMVHLAQEAHCDLIVMGTHGRTGLGRLLLGSVAEKVLRRSACPVLMVKNSVPGTATPLQAQAMAKL